MPKRLLSVVIFYLNFLITCLNAAELETVDIKFTGLKSFEASEILDLLHSQTDEIFDARLVKLDKILLTNFYRKNGFLTVDITDSLRILREKKQIEIIYKINEGLRYYFNEAHFSGNHIFSADQLKSVFSQIKPKSPFDESLINEGKQKIENMYYNKGKPFVELNLDFEFEMDSLVNVKLSISENQTVYIKDIEYIGLKLVQKFLVRRELEIEKGDIYSREKIESSQQNIYSTGLFDYVRFEITPLEDDTTNVILNIKLRERDPRWVGMRIGFAYEQEESYGNKIELTAEGGHRNLFGTARSVSLHLIPSFIFDLQSNKILNPENQITFVYVEPWIGFTRTPGVFQVSYHQYKPLNAADFNVFNTSFNVKHKFKSKIELSGAIGAKFVDVISGGEVDTTLDADVGKDQIYSISAYARKDTRKIYFNPKNSSMSDMSLTYSYSIGKTNLGLSDIKQYITMVSSWQRYQPVRFKLFRKKHEITFASRLKGGAIFELGETKQIPISDLFFAGGATTVRGYSEQLLGPATLDENGFKKNALGGKLLFLANAELRIPLIWLFVGEIFTDAGNVWSEINLFKPADIKYTAGFGIALLTPIGPIRFDYGFKLNKEKSDKDPSAYHIGIYFAF